MTVKDGVIPVLILKYPCGGSVLCDTSCFTRAAVSALALPSFGQVRAP